MLFIEVSEMVDVIDEIFDQIGGLRGDQTILDVDTSALEDLRKYNVLDLFLARIGSVWNEIGNYEIDENRVWDPEDNEALMMLRDDIAEFQRVIVQPSSVVDTEFAVVRTEGKEPMIHCTTKITPKEGVPKVCWPVSKMLLYQRIKLADFVYGYELSSDGYVEGDFDWAVVTSHDSRSGVDMFYDRGVEYLHERIGGTTIEVFCVDVLRHHMGFCIQKFAFGLSVIPLE